ncbi:MAG: AAA family ATPase [Suilimivivens sp.]
MKNAFSFLFTIITGGPGTGKTTVEKVILYIHGKAERRFCITDGSHRQGPSRRMAECTGCTDASTMHSALGLVSEEMESESCDFLEADLILVDEMSMVDMRGWPMSFLPG